MDTQNIIQMADQRSIAIEELRRTVQDALDVADALGLMIVGIRLHQAQVALGEGGEGIRMH